MIEEIRKELCEKSEIEYKAFSSSLIPGVENILGIRLPELRKMAKKIAKGDWKSAISEEDVYFEERMLHGMVLSYIKEDLDTVLPYLKAFIPLVDNWSVCDSVFMGMKVLQTNREKTWSFIQPYLQSNQEFEIRVAVIIMMQHLLKCNIEGKQISRLRIVAMQDLQEKKEEKGKYFDDVIKAVVSVDTSFYYTSMAVAWLIAEAFCVFPYYTMQFLKKNMLDQKTYNKAIQKIIESNVPEKEVKNYLRGYKRK